MELKPGAKLGPYEIQSPLGTGGMGEVYRAYDTRLQRSVAIKVLKVRSNEDPLLRKRIQSEGRAISALQHPNICTLYDIGEQNGLDYLVMECLDGETLAQRLARGPLPLPEFLKYAIEICEGLERAHANGVIHRDLKPGNIMLTKNGAKIMDFGLAKLNIVSSPDAATHSTGLTSPGAMVGTLDYMAPEQIEGAAVDEQSDIFSLGAVFYEMATAKRPFAGTTSASVIAAVLDRDPPLISTVRPEFPRAIDRVVQICLNKKPEDRWRSVHDIKLLLIECKADLAGGTHSAQAIPRAGIAQKALWPLVIIAVLLAAALAAALLRHTTSTAAQRIRSSILPPASWSFLQSAAAISPDGTRLAFVGVGADGATALWVRSLTTGATRQLAPADFASIPFWSPDSGRLGFFGNSKLKIIDVAGGSSPQPLCDAPFSRGGTWNRDGIIVFSPSLYGPLSQVSEKGGVPSPVTRLTHPGSAQAHRWPFFLPDGKHFLFSVDWTPPEDPAGDGIYVGSLDGSAPRLVTSEFTGNVAYASGRLLFVRDLNLMSQRFDLNTLQLSGAAVPVSEQQVPTYEPMSLSAFSVSQNGVVIYQSLTDLKSQLVWFNAAGQQMGQLPAVNPADPHLSPDGRKLVFSSDEGLNGKTYIHIYDLVRNVNTRITDGGAEISPVWSPDGKKIAYVSRALKSREIYQIPSDGSGAAELLVRGPRMDHLDWSSTGEIVCSDFARGRPLLAVFTPGQNSLHELHFGAEARFSPDGHWIAYTLGGPAFQPEVVVESFPKPGSRIQISRNGGAQATWSVDGKRIFFIGPDKRMMAVDFDPRTQSAKAPRTLFQTNIISPKFILRQYDVARDGRFLINSLPSGSAPPITMIAQWAADREQ
ncbi:MAG TPA: protein kinase [Candidatus Angelobacter sp.]|nr:protein kinase [Candidatus Angelobacter sp.]